MDSSEDSSRRPPEQPHKIGIETRSFASWILVSLSLILLTACAYSRIWTGDYQFLNADDDKYVTDNAHVNTGLSRDNVTWAITTIHYHNWHPLTWISLQMDAELFGPNHRAFHITNVVLHAVNSVLLFLVLSRITKSFWRSFAVAGLFAVHPLHVESVAWVTERKDVLSGFFFMLTLWAYASYVNRQTWWRYLAVLIPFALGLTAKQMLVTVPCLLLLLDFWPLQRWGSVPPRRLIAEKIPMLVITALVCLVTMKASAGLVQSSDKFSFADRLANAAVSYVFYLRTTFWPSGLAFWYPLDSTERTWFRVGVSVVLLAAITAVAIAQRKRRPYLLVGWFWFLGMLVPVIGLVQLSNQARADRFTYLPLIGFFIFLTWALSELDYRRLERPHLGTFLVLGLCAIATWYQTAYWHDSKTLWQRSLAVTPNNGAAHLGLAIALENEGNPVQAEEHYEKAVELLGDALSYSSLGNFRVHQGNLEAAHRQFEKAAELAPQNGMIQFQLATILVHQGKLVDALKQLEKVVSKSPEFVGGHHLLALVLSQLGNLDRAVDEMKKVVSLDPQNANANYELGKLLLRLGDIDSARLQFDFALQKNPSHPLAYVGIGTIMARYGNEQSALEQFERALEVDPSNAEAHYLLGASLHNQGNFAEARKHFEAAVKSNPNMAEARLGWGESLLFDGQVNEGVNQLEAAVRLNPRWAQAQASLAFAFIRQGKLAEAVASFKKAAELEPGNSRRHSELALALADNGQKEEARKEYVEASALQSGWVEATRKEAWELMNLQQRRPADGFLALHLARQACGGVEKPKPELLDTLAAAYGEVGNYDAAVETARKALALSGTVKSDLTKKIEQRLSNYEQRRPFTRERESDKK